MSDLFTELKDAEPMEEKAVVAKNETTAPMLGGTDSLLQIAISKDLDIAKLEKLIEMKNREEERQCKKDFDFHFSEMQKEFEPIKRSKQGDKGKYAPVDDLVKQYGKIITKHGFSWWWDEIPVENNALKIVFTVSGYGYSKSNSKVLPEYIPDKSAAGKSIMNVLQAEGTRSTYGYRYTFKAGFGITETDEDLDGNLTFAEGVQYADNVLAIDGCNNLEELTATWKLIYNKLDIEGRKIMFIIYNKKKKELSK